ncbi:unnamed protein product, partial [Tetraodon nigroviridis]
RSQASTLASLIAQMQEKADQVEKDILRSEELLAVDNENEKKEQPFQHQSEISEKLGRAEGLLMDLFLDVTKAKKLNHPQASEIENEPRPMLTAALVSLVLSVSHLHERWLKDCAFYREVYDPVDDVSRMPFIDWGPVFEDKQKQVNSEEFGPTMTDLEKQIAAHNILHKEIQAYSSQLCVSSAGGKVRRGRRFCSHSCTFLQENSKWRQHYLSSLYDYMQTCNKELQFLSEEQDKIRTQDWSDHMTNPPDTRRQYEQFKNNSLLLHEEEVNKLQEEGDRLVEMKHPASALIQAQRDSVRTEWQKFLNLCICQETHLDNVEEFKRVNMRQHTHTPAVTAAYQIETELLSETLNKLNSTLEPRSASQKSNSEMMLQLELEEKLVQSSEQQLADLRRRSTSIAPLNLRRTNPNRPITVESLCDWEGEKGSLARGEKLTLRSISDVEKWNIMSPDGSTKTFPGVCFLIPPPDSEAVRKVDQLGNELADIKKRRAALEASLKNHRVDSSRLQQAGGAEHLKTGPGLSPAVTVFFPPTAPLSSAPLDPKVAALTQQLDSLDQDLARAEESMQKRLRSPLSRTDPVSDLLKRLKEQEEAKQALRALDQQKQAAQADLQPLLSKDSTTSSALPLKLSDASNKHNSIAALADLYNKKANASLNLVNQIKKVDGLVSGFEKNLSEDGPVPDEPNAIKNHIQDIQAQQRSVAAAQGDMKKLSQDLETTEQLCSSLQQGYQEYCPDIQGQRSQVKQLQTRYANVANQLNQRENILQEAGAKNQAYQSTYKSMQSFLDKLPAEQIHSSDDLAQVAAKQSSQERVMDDLKRKADDMNRISGLSLDLQNLLNPRSVPADAASRQASAPPLQDYEASVDRYNSTLEEDGLAVTGKANQLTLADAINKQEKDLVSRFCEATAENTQRQKQMALARNLTVQNEEKVQVVAQQQVQLESQQRNAFELNSLMRELEEEKDRTNHAESDLRTFRDRMLSLKNRKGVERIEEKEVLHYYRDPKLESALAELQNTLHVEALRRSSTQSDIDVYHKRIVSLEDTLKNTPPKLVTKEMTEFEKDPQLDLEAARVREEMARIREEIRVRAGEQIQMKTEVSILQQKKPPIIEKVVVREVLKVEQDPQMLQAVKVFKDEISGESNKIRLLNEQIFQTKGEISALEKIIPHIKPKIVTREIKKVEQDPELITESEKIRSELKDEKTGNSTLAQELLELQSYFQEVQSRKPKVEVKEIINEIYRIDPNTEMEIMRLRKQIQESDKQLANLEREIKQVTSELDVRRAEKPKVELREVLQEVVKEERSPENEREIQRLSSQLNSLHSTYRSLLDKVGLLKTERDHWKAEKSKVETRIVTKEVIKYEADPLLEKEAERLRRNLREESQLRRTIEDLSFDLKNKFLLLDRQKPAEKVVVHEVVRLERDPKQMIEHERLSRSLDDEVQNRRQTELELQQLRTTVEDKEKLLRDSDESHRRIQVESELRELRLRILQLENAPPPVEESIIVEEVLKVERDPKLDKMTNHLRADMDQQTSNIMRLQRDIHSVNVKLQLLQKEKSGEKTVYKEIVRVEKDQAVEAERDRLREQVSQQRYLRQDLEDEIRRLTDKLNLVTTNKATAAREGTSLLSNREALRKEKDDLTQELRKLEAQRHEISLSFHQQSKLMSERTQMSRQRSLRMESDVQRLEKQILEEKERLFLRDRTIQELLQQLQKDEQSETRTKETNISTRISILDPETGKDMSPYDAYLQGMIDRQQYIHLEELECDWEEITSVGPEGETSVLQDRKSGKQYSIKDALKAGRLSEYQVQQYKQGKIPISEFALLVAGEVAGVIDVNTDTCYTVRSASTRKLIDPITAQKLLEAQAATGGIIDITNKERCTVHKAASRGLVDDTQIQRLLNAQKAFVGIEDPMTREVLSVGEAVEKGWITKENALRYMEAQHHTGGLVDPKTGRRVNIFDALGCKMLNSTMLRELQSESTYVKDITDPITKEKISYKQALERCKTDPVSGFPVLPASS